MKNYDKGKLREGIVVSVILGVANLLPLFFPINTICCVLFLIQNILFPFIFARQVIPDLANKGKLQTAFFIGIILGFVPSTMTIFVGIINAYLQNDKGLFNQLKGITFTTQHEIVWLRILTYIYLWVGLLVISGISSFLSIFIRIKK